MNPYVKRAKVVSVHDGDTITVDMDLGHGTWIHGEKIRLANIDAPKLSGEERPAGLVSRDYLRTLIDGKDVTIETVKYKTSHRDKKGKWGRYLATVWLQVGNAAWININQKMIDDGFATKYEE